MKGKYIILQRLDSLLVFNEKKMLREGLTSSFFRTPMSPFHSSNQYFIAASYIHNHHTTTLSILCTYSASWSSIAFLFWILPPRCLSLKGIESHSLIVVVKFLILLFLFMSNISLRIYIHQVRKDENFSRNFHSFFWHSKQASIQ